MSKLEVFTAKGAKKTSTVVTPSGGSEPTADAHIADTADAHDASAVSVLDSGGLLDATNAEDALAELAEESFGTPVVLGGGAYRRSLIAGTQMWQDDEFIGSSNRVLTSASSGTGSVAPAPLVAAEENHPGIFRGTAGTVNNALVTMSSPVRTHVIGATVNLQSGWVIKSPAALSNDPVGCTYSLLTGFTSGQAEVSDGSAMFFYTHSTNGGKWQCIVNDGTQHTADSGVTFDVDTWYYLVVEIDAPAGETRFYINHVLVQTMAFVPALVGYDSCLRKTAAHATTRFLHWDYFYVMEKVSR